MWALAPPLLAQSNDDHKTLRVFIFADQSNMVGSDSKVKNHLKAFNLPPQEKMLVIPPEGIVQLGEVIAEGYLRNPFK